MSKSKRRKWFSSPDNFGKYGIVIILFLVSAFFVKGIYDLKVRAADTSKHFYSVNWHPIWFDTIWISNQVDLMKKTGVQGTRIDVNWHMIETSKGYYNQTYLSRIDKAIDKSAANGIDSLLIVLGTPGWANNNQEWKTPPTNNSDYVNFLKFLIKRYSGTWHAKVKNYEIWNEPDGPWGWTNPNPVQYTALLKAAYTGAKDLDPSVIILGGSLSSSSDPMSLTFLREMYANGAKDYFDILSQHAYGDPPGHGNLQPKEVLDGVLNNILPILQENGDGNKPIWLTEHGYNTSTGGVSEEIQANYLTEFYTYAKELQNSRLPNLENVYYYQWINTGANDVADCPSQSEGNYGLLTNGKNPNCPASINGQKPAYHAFKTLALGLTPTPTQTPTPSNSPTLTPTSTPTITPSNTPTPTPTPTPTWRWR